MHVKKKGGKRLDSFNPLSRSATSLNRLGVVADKICKAMNVSYQLHPNRARCSSVVRASARDAMGRRIDPS